MRVEPTLNPAVIDPASRRSRLAACGRRLLIGMILAWTGIGVSWAAQSLENRVLELDGMGSYVELPDRLGEDWEAATVEFRVRWDGLSYYGTAVQFGDSDSAVAFNQNEDFPTPRVASQRGRGRVTSISLEDRVELGVWVHLAATFEASRMRFWVNGVCLGTNAIAAPGLTVLKGAPSRWLGRSAWKENGYFRGKIDEVRLWSRTLSDEELARLPVVQVLGTEPGLYARWSMDTWSAEPSGTVCWSDGAQVLPAVLRGGARAVVDETADQAAFSAPWWLEGTVRGPDGLPVPADLRWLEDDLSDWHVSSDAEGRFRWRGLRSPQSGMLRATAGPIGTLARVDLKAGAPVRLDLTLEASASVEGTIVRWDGAPRAGVGLRIRPSDPDTAQPEEGWITRSDRLGRFAFPALPDGEYEMECDSRPDTFSPSTASATPTQRVRVRRSEGPAQVTFRVAAGVDGTPWRRFTRRDGLPDNALTSLALDGKGMLWIGTSAGLARFDGMRFTAWTDELGLAGGRVDALAVDGEDQLWIAGNHGLVRRKGTHFEPVSIETARAGLSIFDMTRSRDGAMWLATDQGVHRYRDGSWRVFGVEQGLPGSFVRWVWPDADDSVRVSITDRLMVRLSDRGVGPPTSTRFLAWGVNPLFSPAPGGDATNVERTKWKRVTFPLMRGDGVSVNPEFIDIPWALEVRSILEANQRETWVATHQHGLIRIASETTQSLTSAHGLPAAGVRVSLRARDGTLWIGTSGGVVRWNGGATTLYLESDGLPGNAISDLLQTADGTIWVAGNRGVARWAGGRFQTVPGAPFAAVHALRTGPDGRVWALAPGVGLLAGNEHGLHAMHADSMQPHVWSMNFLPTKSGGLIVGTSEGIVSIRDGQPVVLGPGQKPVWSPVLALLESKDGTLWVGTDTTGLHRRDRHGVWSRFDLADGLASRVVRALHEDARGWLWVGTSAGVNLYRDGLWNHMDETDGLAGLDVRHIRSEEDGSVWFSTDGGLTRYVPSQRTPQAAWRDTAPDEITGSSASEIRGLTGRRLDFAVETATGNWLRWRVRDGDKLGDWTSLRGRHEWTWVPTNVGRVTLETQVMDRDLNPSPILSREIQVEAKWYRRPLVATSAGTIAVGVTGILVYLATTLRRQRQESARLREEARILAAADLVRMDFERRLIRTQEAERGRISRELHDCLGQELLLIRNSALLARQGNPETPVAPALGEIADRASRTIEEIRGIAYALRPQELDRYGLAEAMRSLCRELAAVDHPAIEFVADQDLPPLGPEMEIGLFRILQECLTNVLKHAGASRVQCWLGYRNSGVELRVSDDGCGFDSEVPATREAGGLGLSGMRERVRLLGGEFRVDSHPARGTTVTVWILAPPVVGGVGPTHDSA